MMADGVSPVSPTARLSLGAGEGGSQVAVGELTEEQLLARITPLLPHAARELVGNGDDCAVIAAPDGRFVVSTDVLVEGHHFRCEWSTAAEVGWRAAAQNLADVAAMGAVPTAMVVGLVVPPATPVAWVEGFAQGLGEAAREAGCGVVGGDLSAGEQIVVAITVHGDLQGRAPVTRGGAKPGDLVVHVGDLGCSAAGLALLQAGISSHPENDLGEVGLESATDRSMEGGNQGEQPCEGGAAASAMERCLRIFRSPQPPLAAGPALAMAGASAMMDVSDSLLRDCGRIARASGAVIDLDAASGRLAQATRALESVARLLGLEPEQARAQALAWVLTGGEDHGMLATIPAGATLPEGVEPIGRVLPAALDAATGHPAGTVLVNGSPHEGPQGWDHFSAA